MEYRKHLSEPWFSLIKTGLKKCEGRLKKGDFAEMKKGDYIIFENSDVGFKREFRVKITSIHNYNSFGDYLSMETLEKCLPGVNTMEEGLSIYYKYYSKQDEEKYKIVAIRIKVKN
jgi:ASC-1-like (ASCH) protein